jgi:hypothetical protein
MSGVCNVGDGGMMSEGECELCHLMIVAVGMVIVIGVAVVVAMMMIMMSGTVVVTRTS